MNDKEFIVWLQGFFDGMKTSDLSQNQRDMIDTIRKKIESLNKKPDLSLPIKRDFGPIVPEKPCAPIPWVPPFGSEPYRSPNVNPYDEPYPVPQWWRNPNMSMMGVAQVDNRTTIRRAVLEDEV